MNNGQCRLLALSGHPNALSRCPLLGGIPEIAQTSENVAYDSTRTTAALEILGGRIGCKRPDMRHGGRRTTPNAAEPDANVLDQIYSEKLAWRFPKVVEERRRRVLKRVPVNRKTAPCKTRAFDVARCVL